MNPDIEIFAGEPFPDEESLSLEVNGKEIRIGGEPDLADFLNDAFLYGKVQVFGLTLLKQLSHFFISETTVVGDD